MIEFPLISQNLLKACAKLYKNAHNFVTLQPLLRIFNQQKSLIIMKKSIILLFALIAITSCGNTGSPRQTETGLEPEAAVPDTLNTVEAVERQVNAIYDYWNELRENYNENMPSVDELFGSKEWQQVRKEVEDVDRDCECGGFFDFGEEGPLDAWTYDCYEGTVSANDIQVKLQPDSTAEVWFLVKDAVTIDGIPMRWLMRIEDGQWRVANIFFEKEDGFDILMGMRAYVDAEKDNNTNLTDDTE